MKKLVTGLLAICLMCALSIPAHAADVDSAPTDLEISADGAEYTADIPSEEDAAANTEGSTRIGLSVAQELTEDGLFIYVGDYTLYQEEGTSIWALAQKIESYSDDVREQYFSVDWTYQTVYGEEPGISIDLATKTMTFKVVADIEEYPMWATLRVALTARMLDEPQSLQEDEPFQG